MTISEAIRGIESMMPGQQHRHLELVPDITPTDEVGVFMSTEKIRSAAFIAKTCVPYTLEIPDQVLDPTPLVIINGYAGKKFGYDRLRSQVARLGKPAISLNPPRSQGLVASLDPNGFIHPEELQSQAVWGVMRDVQKQHDHDKRIDIAEFDLAGHSMGGFVATALARHKPESVKSITYVESVGLEDHSLAEFRPRAVLFFLNELIPALVNNDIQIDKGKLHAIKSELHYIFHNPLRTIAEGVAVANCNIREDVRYLKQTHGIGTALVLGSNDELIPPDETIRLSSHLFDYQHIIEGGHLLPITQPEIVAASIFELIDRMNNAREIAS